MFVSIFLKEQVLPIFPLINVWMNTLKCTLCGLLLNRDAVCQTNLVACFPSVANNQGRFEYQTQVFTIVRMSKYRSAQLHT